MNPPVEPSVTTPSAEEIHFAHIVPAHGLPTNAISARLDGFIRTIGEIASWVWFPLMFVIIINVVMRYALGQGRIELEEIQWHLYSIGFIVGLSYCYQSDSHVRIDILHDRLSLKAQAWIELFGILFFLLPFITLVIIYTVPFVYDAYKINEISQAPGGLPYRWLIKSVLLIGFCLLSIATISRFLRCSSFLFRFPKPLSSTGR
ncbi:TRAP-type mannitol/chloroaromatic compound transport system, small permease component [Beggiatoa alba B18LD]|uniref:TRAP transporter small permease protein n=1 Tax=Beggiatoa alba B18LD TaxID=395493 RepID=I3CEH0_9GAMM|nr:TRAP transporter small permease subunit [Beggiatoa alba]EIJ42013.1 TRAP-type mannitol/chloroaromatic compound transport system, small permease component [Beggiatoa alba B18LD]